MKITIGKEVQDLCRKCQNYLTAKFANGEEMRYCGAWRKHIVAPANSCDFFMPMGVMGKTLDEWMLKEALEGQQAPLDIIVDREKHTAGFIKVSSAYKDPDTVDNAP